LVMWIISEYFIANKKYLRNPKESSTDLEASLARKEISSLQDSLNTEGPTAPSPIRTSHQPFSKELSRTSPPTSPFSSRMRSILESVASNNL
jgi:hypothetical protein